VVARPATPTADRGRSLLARPFHELWQIWRRIRSWRRIHFTAGGFAFTLGVSAVGFAAINTGNNLLHLLLGAMLGLIVVSGWMSERMIRDLVIERDTPKGITVGQEARITYRVRNVRKRIPSLAVEIVEEGLADRAFLPKVPAGGAATTRSFHRSTRRGVHALETVTLSTGFPFGLFIKERDIKLPGELVVWPRANRALRPPVQGAGRQQRRTPAERGGLGIRGEYRSLHEYRPGDDARDIHWKSSARMRSPVVREYESDASEDLWICLDCSGPPGDVAEDLIEIAASLAARAAQEGRRFGLAADGPPIHPASGPRQLERVFDALARAEFRPDAPPLEIPTDVSRCVLVSMRDRPGFADTYTLRSA
jgi:uncharacterized protein (DUF58 family)